MRRRDLFVAAGALTAWPFATRAQQPGRVYRLALAHPTSSIERLTKVRPPRLLGAAFEELRRRGYVEGRNLAVEAYSGEGKADRYRGLAEKVVATKPDVIFVMGDLADLFKAATATIPIVAVPNDPLAHGLVASLAHPGGNITGVATNAGVEIWGKRLGLLLQALPKATRIAYLTLRADWEAEATDQPAVAVRDAAKRAGVLLVPALLDVPVGDAEYRRAFMQIARDGMGAMLLGAGAEHFPYANLLAQLATSSRLPALFPDRSFADEGGMMSYGVDFADLFRHAGSDIAEILEGVKPGEIPFYRPNRYELVVNLKTATALGIEMPALLLAGATDVIE